MNKDRFVAVMTAVDDDLLEEAQRTVKRSHGVLRFAALAACLCLVVGLLWPRTAPSALTAADLQEYGYHMELPAGAAEVVYALIDLGEAFSVPMAQATFVQDGAVYTCRAQKTGSPTELQPGQTTLAWTEASLSLQQRQQGDETSVAWYEPESGTQWCLSSEKGNLALINTARQIIESLGYQMAVAPEGATEIVYDAFMVGDLTAAQTEFTLEGVRYAFRTAAANGPEDLSELEIPGARAEAAEIGWCSAEMHYVEGGTGKILWYDMAPGLLYSLTMETGASREKLVNMADLLYTPAQGDVG